MTNSLRPFAGLAAWLAIGVVTAPVFAQQSGGVLKVHHQDSPASMSILEEATYSTVVPMMGVFNNLVMYKQDEPQNSMKSILPDLAASWSWSEDGTELTFKLRQGVKWHDGKPFTAADVKCTYDLLLGKAKEKLRINPRKAWFRNLEEVTADSNGEATFHLRRPQPAFITLLASGYSPIYPCHVSPRDMRTHPIGTGPFKFVSFKANESIKVERNPDYWKPGRPYLDGIEYTIVPNRSTAILAFVAGKLDMTWPYIITVPLLKDIQTQAPQAICELKTTNASTNLLVNRDAAPFDNPDLRKALQLALDRKAFVDILSQGQGEIGGILQPPPSGLWGMPPDQVTKLPGYDPDVHQSREQARQIMQKLGYSPDKTLKIKVTARNWSIYRDPAVLLIDQLKHVYIDGELELVDTAQYFPKIQRKDYTVALNLQTSGPDPGPVVQLFYGCGSNINWDGYCNPEMDKLIEQQSREADTERRKQLLWTIERKLAEDNVRPIIFYSRGGTCERPYVKGLTIMVNSIFNGWRMEDVWLDK